MNEDAQTARHVRIVPMGSVDRVVLSVIAANIQTFTGLLADVADSATLPEYAFMPGRGQYNALAILQALHQDAPSRDFRLGVLAVDLCLPILSHVYGEAIVGGKTAVVSLFRLRHSDNGTDVPEDVYYLRAAKISVHEIAHAMGLKHCCTPGCLMAFAVNLEKLDRVGLRFCPTCSQAVAASTG